jgi:hypothetical protein
MAEFVSEAERLGKASRPHVNQAPGATADIPAHPLLRLQGAAGNRAVARMVQRHGDGDDLQMKHDPSIQRSEGAEAEEEELQMKHDPSIQRSEGAEAEEEELQMKHDPSIQRSEGAEAEEEELQMKHDPSIQRSEGAEAEEEELQMKHDPSPRVGLEGGPVGGDISSQIDSMRGSGSGLDSGFREKMESGFGHDFSDVKVHQDSQSDVLNRQMTAKAFTTGSDIFLRSDASTGDSHLMAHELSHVVQQRSGVGGGGEMTAGPADDPLEHEADQTADAVLSGAAQRKLENEQA